MPFAAGTRLGPYEIQSALGAGGMGEVYKARDARLGRSVAIKVLPPEVSADSARRARFEREARTIAGFSHPHICSVFDAGEHDGSMYLVMEYLAGETLAQRLQREPLRLEQALGIAAEIADALATAHRQGVIHRDLKPANVMLTGTGAKLLDFGLAKLSPSSTAFPGASTSGLPTQDPGTAAGTILGTVPYMAPEQVEGREADARSDIFSFGAVLYEMLSGRRAFEGQSPASVMAAILDRNPPPLSAALGPAQPGLERLVRKCLEKDPDRRWQSAADIADELRWLAVGPDIWTTVNPTSGSAARGRAVTVSARNEIVEDHYRLSAAVCRGLEREELDPRMIGDQLVYLDNRAASDVLVVYLHGFGGDHRAFRSILEASPYRGVAVTLYGFEPSAARRTLLSLKSHCHILRAFLGHVARTAAPRFTIFAGFSSGADVGFRLLAEWPTGEALPVDAFLGIGCNLSLDTCFVSRVLAGDPSEGAERVLQNLRSSGARAASLAEWLNTHEYLVQILRKFQSDLRPLHLQAKEIIGPFEGNADPFPGWFRAASERVRMIRCVFADTDMESQPVKRMLLANLDSGLLGSGYHEDSIQIEPGADHFDLLSVEKVNRHVADLVEKAGNDAPAGTGI